MQEFSRRTFLRHAAITLTAATPWPTLRADNTCLLRFGLTPVISYKQSRNRELMAQYLEDVLDVRVQFFERQKYSEIIQMLHKGELDIAWVCGYPYVTHQDQLRLITTPLYEEQPLYQSYLITHQDAPNYSSILDFENKVFAFSDPDSLSGHIIPKYDLIRLNRNPDHFFKRSLYTYRHEWVVDAVVDGLAQGGHIDGYVWETLKVQQDKNVLKTRIVCKSNYYAFPPLVAPITTTDQKAQALIAAFVDMAQHPLGAKLLQSLNLDGFQAPDSKLYGPIEHIAEVIQQYEGLNANQ